jgi:hypothetical protein
MNVVRASQLLAAVAAVASIAACGNLVDPDLPANAEQFTPPPVYARWWSMTESCSGFSGDLSTVTWFMVPGVSTVLLDGKPVEGYWSLAGNRIVLAGNGRLSGGIVRHEMLHALMKAGGHPRARFLAACGGVVYCTEACISDAGPPPAPDPAAIQVGPEGLEVRVDVAAGRSEPRGGRRILRCIVSVRNPSTGPVVVNLPPQPIGVDQGHSCLM